MFHMMHCYNSSMKVFPHFIILLSVALVRCTDLSKVDKKDKKNPLESISKEEEKVEMIPDSAVAKTEAEAEAKTEVSKAVEGEDESAPPMVKDTSPDPLAFPLGRVIEDLGGRKIDVVIMAKRDGKIGFNERAAINGLSCLFQI